MKEMCHAGQEQGCKSQERDTQTDRQRDTERDTDTDRERERERQTDKVATYSAVIDDLPLFLLADELFADVLEVGKVIQTAQLIP